MISRTGINPGNKSRINGFTLIELILVMTILSAVIVVSAPSLSRFFRGQSLEEESRRFLAITRFAMNKAISEGIPMTLWIDTNLYGLKPQDGYQLDIDDELVFELEEGVHIEIVPVTAKNNEFAEILFSPDGTIDENLIELIRFQRSEKQPEDSGEIIDIEKSLIGMKFEIIDPNIGRRRLNIQ